MPTNAKLAAADRTVVSRRVIPAPRTRVFDAFRDARQLAGWWGPDGFTNTIHALDLRPGGLLRVDMHGPDGAVYENEYRFVAIEPERRIEYRHEDPVHAFTMTMDFADAEVGRTRLTWTMTFDDPAEFRRVRDLVVPANEQNFDRLQELLRTPENKR